MAALQIARVRLQRQARYQVNRALSSLYSSITILHSAQTRISYRHRSPCWDLPPAPGESIIRRSDQAIVEEALDLSPGQSCRRTSTSLHGERASQSRLQSVTAWAIGLLRFCWSIDSGRVLCQAQLLCLCAFPPSPFFPRFFRSGKPCARLRQRQQ